MLKEKIIHLENGDEKYPLLFSTNVMETLQTEFDEVDVFKKMQGSGIIPDMRILNFMLTEIINEGIKYTNRFKDKKREFISKEEVGWLITDVGWETSFKLIKEAIQLCMPAKSETSKKAKTTQSADL